MGRSDGRFAHEVRKGDRGKSWAWHGVQDLEPKTALAVGLMNPWCFVFDGLRFEN